MPHCTLEYSANVVDAVDPRALFVQLHQALVEIEAFDLADIKSRAHRLDTFVIGDGHPDNAMVHLRFALLAGRDISVRQRIVQTCMRVLQQHFARSLAEKKTALSVEVAELERSTYAKANEPATADPAH